MTSQLKFTTHTTNLSKMSSFELSRSTAGASSCTATACTTGTCVRAASRVKLRAGRPKCVLPHLLSRLLRALFRGHRGGSPPTLHGGRSAAAAPAPRLKLSLLPTWPGPTPPGTRRRRLVLLYCCSGATAELKPRCSAPAYEYGAMGAPRRQPLALNSVVVAGRGLRRKVEKEQLKLTGDLKSKSRTTSR
eukprot:COSAG04_NODE_1326_length_7211_cov_1.774606_11_plen_190_part_00